MSSAFKDQLGRTISIKIPIHSIISIVPSQTELLFTLGLGKNVKGRTKFCVHPKPEIDLVRKVGGTKSLDLDIIDEICPDIIIGNKEENTKEQILELEKRYPVWMSDVKSFSDSYQLITQFGNLFQLPGNAKSIIDFINEKRSSFIQREKQSLRVLYFIWRKPYMVAGVNTFINSMLNEAGFINHIKEERYPMIDLSSLNLMEVDLILLPSEPFPFKSKHIQELDELIPNIPKILVNGEYFSWYGSRLAGAFDYFTELWKIIEVNVLNKK